MKASRAFLIALVLVMLISACQPSFATPSPTETEAPVAVTEAPVVEESTASSDPTLVDDFEATDLATGQDQYATVGFLTWSDGSPVSIEIVEGGSEVENPPDMPDGNHFIKVSTEIRSGGWGGFSHAFANASLDKWITQDWSAYEGISMWIYGNNTGGSVFIDLLENRAPDSAGDDAERWTYNIIDDFEGWQHFEMPFTEFRRKDIGNGAPNDGQDLVEVHGYAFGAFGSTEMGAQVNYIDDVRLYGIAPIKPLEVTFQKENYSSREGSPVKMTISLNKPSDTPVSVVASMAESQSIANRDYVFEPTKLTFAPGETKISFEINILDDQISDDLEQSVVALSQPEGAIVGLPGRAILTIRDDDPVTPGLIYDFETPPHFVTNEAVSLSLLDIPAGDKLALPDQAETVSVLMVNASKGNGLMSQRFTVPQDWSDKNGLSFWWYGTGSNDKIDVNLQTNQSIRENQDKVLVWSDEFNGPAGASPNFGLWQPELGDGKLNGLPGWGNSELEYYTANPENVSMDGEGNLVITAKQTDPQTNTLQCWYDACEYTSARLITRDAAEFKFGRIEARLKLPTGQGIWPAFWMLGTDLNTVGWPQSGEIDIMELVGRSPDTAYGTIHGPGYAGGASIGSEYKLDSGIFADDFHTFAIEWAPDRIDWYVDDFNFFSATPDTIPAGTEWVYNHPFFIILNIAVGGNFPGNPDATSVYPQTMSVDYVRVYQMPAKYDTYTYSFRDNFTGWQQIDIPFDEMKGKPDATALGNIWQLDFSLAPKSDSVFYMKDLKFIVGE